MFKKYYIWILFSVFSIFGLYIAYTLFPRAFALLNKNAVNLQMNREEAFLKSEELSKQFNIGPSNASQVATFGVDQDAQNYIELELGGAQTFIEILKNKYYEAYTWQVRHYLPGNVNEAWFQYTPEGNFYGFYETLSDELFIESLNAESALELAVQEASIKWNVNFINYNLIEQSKETKSSNRVDHTFIYKRDDIQLGGEGEYRLKLIISGNKLTTIERYIKIPETFDRKYSEMRSSNNTIATIATFGMFIFYFLGGILAALFFLNRNNFLIWKTAIYWAIFIAFIMLLSQLNFLPLSWLGYDTAVSKLNFILQNILFSILNLFIMIVYLTLSFVAAESLSRKAFPHHIKFWNLWTNNNPSSKQIIGRTLGGYLLIGFDLFYVVTFYTIASTYFGWWTPSSTLFSPDMIATPFPWLSAVGMSLHAGFWEECLFRAIPLAGAACIGMKYGNKRIWIIAALLLQAFIFAGAHANYPSYPAYSRLIELMIPSIVWGLIYLKFGLLPAIISHFGYDAVLFSLPLFTSNAPNLTFDRFMVFVLTLIPAWIILRSIIKSKGFFDLDLKYLNSSFKAVVKKKTKVKVDSGIIVINSHYRKILYILTLIGISSIIYSPPLKYNNNSLKINRTEALNLAEDYMFDNDIFLDSTWTETSKIWGKIDRTDRYIWETQGEVIYQQMLGTYLDNSLWYIRYVKFQGDVNDKTEEYAVLINNDGTLNQIRHKIPENWEGERLSQSSAEIIALNYIQDVYNLTNQDIKSISVEPSSLPHRDDWEFIYSDTTTFSLNDGEPRIKINIAGNDVVSSARYIHIPEDWEREDKDKQTFINILNTICFFSLVFLVIYATSNSISRWSRGSFNVKIFVSTAIIFFTISIINLINKTPEILSDFTTDNPFVNQLISSIGFSLLFSIISIFVIAAIIGNTINNINKPSHQFNLYEIIFIAVSIIGLTNIALTDSNFIPRWVPHVNLTNSYFPIISHLDIHLFKFINATVILLFIVKLLNIITNSLKKRQFLAFLLIFFITIAINGSSEINDAIYWLNSSFILAIIYFMLYKLFFVHDISIIPMIISIILCIDQLSLSATNAYPYILSSNILSSLMILFVGYYLRGYILTKSRI